MRSCVKSVMLPLFAACIATAGTTWTLKVGTRSAVIYAPDARDKPALVISMHGIGGGSWWTPGAMKYEALADTANFVVAYPEGENSQWDLGGDKDVNFVLAIIDSMYNRYGIDRDRVYASGFSMGGMMSWYLSCRIPDKIAAIVPGNGYPLYGMSGCSEVRHVPALQIHGTADDFVSYSGFVSSFLPSQIGRYGCPSSPRKTSPYPVGANGRNASQLAQPSKSFLEEYGPCEKDGLQSELALLSVDGMIHDWATPDKANGSDDPAYKGKPFDVNGTWEAWNFMRTHTLKGDVPIVTVPAPRDTVFNGSFALGSLGWTFNTWEGTAQGAVANGEYVLDVSAVGENASGIQLVQNGIVLVQGQSYEVTFDAYAGAPRTLQANVEQDDSPWASYLPGLQEFGLTTAKASYSYRFAMGSPTDSNGRVTFNAGGATGTVHLDNVAIRKLDKPLGVARSAARGRFAAVVRDDGTRLDVALGVDAGTAVSIALCDLAGRSVRSTSVVAANGRNPSCSVDLAGLPRGVYVLKVDVDGTPVLRTRNVLGR